MGKKILSSVLLLAFFAFHVTAQQYSCPFVNAGADQTLSCSPGCTTLAATYLASGATSSYAVAPITYAPYPYLTGTAPPAPFYASNGIFSSPVPLPFAFCFFGAVYDSVVIGTNGVISFSVDLYAGQTNAGDLVGAGTIPSVNLPVNSIMAPYMDLLPGGLAAANANYVNYATIGTAPCRKFVISFYQVPFDNTSTCPTDYLTSQTVLYETTNVIEVYIGSKVSCTAQYSGLAIEGIQNAAGTVAYPVTGRNNTVWTATNDAYRWTPSGANDVVINWYQAGTLVGTGASVSVCPPANRSTTYVATATYQTCAAPYTVMTDTVVVNAIQSAGPTQYLSCPSASAAVTMAASGTGSWTALSSNPTAVTIANSGSPTTVITGFAATGTYRFQWSSGACYDTASVIVTTRANAGPDQNGCRYGTVTMAAAGTGTWSALASNPVVASITAPTRANTTITGFTAGGAYSFVWTTAAGCSDTMVVTIPAFSLAISAGSTSVCQYSNTSITVTPSPAGLSPFQYTWLDSTMVVSPHSASTGVYPLPGSMYFHVLVTSSDGCMQRDSILISTTASTGATIHASANPTTVCAGSPSQLTVLPDPNSCGLATTACTGTTATVNAGTAATFQSGGSNQYPSPYGNFFQSAHHQFLILASELIGQVPSGGQIKSIAFDVHTVNGASSITNFTISLGCTSVDSLDGAFVDVGSLTQVYTNASFLPTTGWNVHNFPTAYNWDGVSNLVVDVCFATNTNNNINPKMYYTTTPFQSVWCTYGNNTGGTCNIVGTQANPPVPYAQLFQRPNMQFNMCVPNLNGANLLWTPNTGANAPSPATLDTVTAHPLTSTQYRVALTSANGCVNYSYVTVSVDTSTHLSLNNDTFMCIISPIHLHAVVTGDSLNPAVANDPVNQSLINYIWSASAGAAVPPSGTGASYATPTVIPSATTRYTVAISGGGTCPVTDSVIITLGSTLPVSSIVDSITCAGSSTGRIYINMNAGTPPYRYTWTPAAANADSLVNLAQGTYTVLVTDTIGCTGRDTVKLSSPAALTLLFDSTNIACYNVNIGTVTAVVAGGRTPYRYTWSNGGGNTNTLTGLAAGTYHLTVTDTSGCTISGTVNVKQPPQLTSTANATSLTGYGTHNGTITVNSSGGTPGYTYTSVPAVSGLPNATGLDTGTYIITVCDANHCCVTDTVHITQPPLLVVNFNTTNGICYGYCTGTAIAVPTGGVAPYTYGWATVPPTSSLGASPGISFLCPGTYQVTVTDHNGNSVVKDTFITDPVKIAMTVDSTSVTCHGTATGSLKDSAYLGVSPYTYTWTPGGTTNPINNLTAGMYIINVKDANNCSVTDTVYLVQPVPLVALISATDSVTCFGYANGYASVQAAGGTPPYTYAWSGSNSLTSSAGNLIAGLQTVTVTDHSGCTASAPFTIYQPTVLTSVATSTALTGYATHNGTITVSPSGGTPGYTYTSVPAVSGLPNATGLDTGTYIITICDIHHCCVNDTVHITQPPPLVVTFTIANNLCYGYCNGSATAVASGGASPYTYSWATVPPSVSLGTSVSASGLCAGTYQVTVTDHNGNHLTRDTVITAPVRIAMSVDSTSVTCNGTATGSLKDSAYLGVSPYTYTWTPGGVANPINNLVAGMYIVNVKDANNCSVTDTVYLVQPTPVTASITATDSVTCFGYANGYASVQAGGGRPPYTYAWSGSGSVTSSASTLIAGLQTVTVTDHSGCTASAPLTIYQPTRLSSTVASTNLTGPGTNNGTITITPSGGSPGYTYTSVPAIAGLPHATGLDTGIYIITVHDAKGCAQSDTVDITAPPPILITFATVNNLCYGYCNGTATASAVGGVHPYTYVWNTVPATIPLGTSAGISGLCAGTYQVIVTDSNGIHVSKDTIITAPVKIAMSVDSTSVTCTGTATGSLKDSAYLGVSPYTYTWTPGGIANPINNLLAGMYIVNVKDANNCSVTDTVYLVPPTPVTASITATDSVTCYSGNNGFAGVQAAGGRPPYTYAWSGSNSVNSSANNLSAGPQTVTVTDHSGCTASAPFTIYQPTPLTSTVVSTDLTGAGTNNGTITITPSGGSPGYTYTSVPTISGLPAATGLDTGTYIITIHDAKGCTQTDTIDITGPPPIAITFSTVNNLCFGYCQGIISAHASGGVRPYTYSWGTVPASTVIGTGDTITGLCTGIYQVTVTDSNGIQTSKDTIIIEPPAVADVIDSTPITCHGAGDGALLDSAYLGFAPYSYTWSPGGNVNPITNLSPGTYTVTATDAHGCIAIDTVYLTQPDPVTVAIISTDSTTCFGYSNGYANVVAAGGRLPYTYVWSGSNSVDSFATNLPAGAQTVTVTDHSSCTASAPFTIYQPTQITSTVVSTNLTGAGTNNGTITITPSGGTPGYTYTSVPAIPGLPNATGLDTGTYIITVHDAKGCTQSDTIDISGPPPIEITFTTVNNLCSGYCTGTATASVSGGVPPYTYSWTALPTGTSLGTGTTITNLCNGTYHVIVTDSNHIQTSKDTIITSPAPVSMVIDSTPVTCYNASNGTLRDSVWGGTGPYVITWTPGGGINPLIGQGPGMYIVHVSDFNGCTGADTAYLGQPPPLLATILSTDSVTCAGGSNGFANVLGSGGTPPYTYTWSGSASVDSFASNLSAGPQTVTVTDHNHCTMPASFVIYQPSRIVVSSVATTPAHCASSHDGAAVATVSGGSPGYTYSWDGTGTGSVDSITGLVPGNHNLTVTDNKGCPMSAAFSIDTIYVLHIAMGSDSVSCDGGDNGVAFTAALNGTPPYTYAWSPASSSMDSATSLRAGVQNVSVKDMYGCPATGSVMVSQPGPVTDHVYFTNPLCFSEHNGKLWVSAGGTVGPYTYTFDDTIHPVTDTIFGLAQGSYYLTITDAKGCTKEDSATLINPLQLMVPPPVVKGISCSNDYNGVIQVNPIGGTLPYTYTWNIGGFTTAQADSLWPATYDITVTDANGCHVSVTDTLSAPPRISLFYEQADSASCPDSADGHIVVDPTGGTPGYFLPYTYSINGTTYQANHNFYDLLAGTYTVYVKDSPGCVFDTMLSVYQPAPITASVLPQDSLIALGSSLQLYPVIVNNTTQSINSYTWTPSVGLSCLDCPDPVASPYQNTEYYLTVNYGKNCTVTTSTIVQIGPGASVYIPNAFTPNGDGVNDVFSVFGTTLQSVSMQVFDRWGEKVFDSGDSQWASWDGAYRGVMELPGVYIYYVQLVYLDGKQEARQGSLTLIR